MIEDPDNTLNADNTDNMDNTCNSHWNEINQQNHTANYFEDSSQ